MPLIFRAMLADGDRPKTGICGRTLGVRLKPGKVEDIPVEDGTVAPMTGGMSVAPSLEALPHFLVPARLRSRYPRARGNDNLVCWKMGAGDFVDSPVSDKLHLRPDPHSPTRHAFVEPAARMSVEEYQQALGDTREEWANAED